MYVLHVCIYAGLCEHMERSLLQGSGVGWREEAVSVPSEVQPSIKRPLVIGVLVIDGHLRCS